MAYDEELAGRIRDLVSEVPGVNEIKMFGGLCFTVNGNMACGQYREVLMVRVGPDKHDEVLAGGVAREMAMGGRAMRGMVEVDGPVVSDDEALADWVQRGVDFASSLPPKKPK